MQADILADALSDQGNAEGSASEEHKSLTAPLKVTERAEVLKALPTDIAPAVSSAEKSLGADDCQVASFATNSLACWVGKATYHNYVSRSLNGESKVRPQQSGGIPVHINVAGRKA